MRQTCSPKAHHFCNSQCESYRLTGDFLYCLISLRPESSQFSQGDFSVIGIGEELEALSKIGDRSVFVSLIGIGITAVVIGDSQIRLDLDSPVVIGDRSVFVSLIGIGKPAAGIGLSEIRFELDGPVVIGDRSVFVSLIAIGKPREARDGTSIRSEP